MTMHHVTSRSLGSSKLFAVISVAALLSSPAEAARITLEGLLAQIQALQAQVEGLQADNTALKAKLACVSAASTATNVYFDGCNVHVRNGTGGTYSSGVNGLGNLIVGYNELRGSGDVRTGSHNVILGFGQNYRSTGAFMSGAYNNGDDYFASVIGGTGNTSSGLYSVVVGGYNNTASGNWSTILGGQDVMAPNVLDHKP